MTPPAPTRPNPYVGPRSFNLREAYFFGRTWETAELANLLTARRVVLFHSPAGAGKTSLIQAALVPALEAQDFHVRPVLRLGRSGTDPAGNRYVQSALLSLDAAAPAGTSLPDYLAQHPGPAGRPEVLIFDQFEEVFTAAPDDHAGRAEFFRQLAVLCKPAKAGPRWVLFSFREEYLGVVSEFLKPLPTGAAVRFRLDLLTEPGALEAIREPALAQGVTFGPGAAERLVRNLSRGRAADAARAGDGLQPTTAGLGGPAGYVEPVQLQVVCYRLWDRVATADRSVISVTDVDQYADVDNALAGYYAEKVQWAAAQGASEWDIRRWFDESLITPTGVRAVIQEGPAGSGPLSRETVSRLADAYLVRREQRHQNVWLELSHDRLVEPVRRDNRAWFAARLQPFQVQADEFAARTGPAREDLRLSGPAPAAAEQWAAANANRLRPADKELLDASRAARTTRDRARTLIFQWWAILSSTVMVVIVGLLIFGLFRYRAEQDARQVAENATRAADEARKAAVGAADEARAAATREAAARKETEKRLLERDAAVENLVDQNVRYLSTLADKVSLLATADNPADLSAARQALEGVSSPHSRQLLDRLKVKGTYSTKTFEEGRQQRQRETLQFMQTVGNELLPKDPRVQVLYKQSLRRTTYAEVIAVTRSLSQQTEPDKAKEKEFWGLYYGKMVLVEGPDVARAMIAFGYALKEKPRDPEKLRAAAAAVRDECEKEIRQAAAAE